MGVLPFVVTLLALFAGSRIVNYFRYKKVSRIVAIRAVLTSRAISKLGIFLEYAVCFHLFRPLGLRCPLLGTTLGDTGSGSGGRPVCISC